jgi:hypothetical protein
MNNELLAKKDEILKLRTKIKGQGKAGKRKLEREWYRNCMFLVGRQWIFYDKSKGKWVDWDAPSWYEKPVTNKFAVCHNTLKTILTQQDPRIIIRPAMDNEESIATSEIADIAVDVIQEEANMKQAKEIASSWVVSTGNAFFYNYFEVSGEKYGVNFIQHEQCVACGSVSRPNESGECEKCGNREHKEAMDENSQAVGETIENGKLCCEAVPPFEMFFNPEVQDFTEITEVVRSKSVPMDLLKEMFPQWTGGASGSGAKDKSEQSYLKGLAYSSSSGTPEMVGGGSGSDKVQSENLDYVFSLPCKDFPNGLSATLIGDEILEADELMYRKQDGKYFLPFIHVLSERVPGRMFGKTKLDDIAYKQIELNKLKSFILLWVYSMSGGKWLEPEGTNMDKPTGQPNQKIKYTRGVNGEKPELVNGIQVPPAIFQLLEIIESEINDLAATYDVLKGELPQGLDTASGLRMLTERAFSRHNEMIRNWERALEDCTIQQIEIARQFFTEERKKTLENDMGSWETKTFTKADLQGGLEIKIEPGSTIPRSKAAENASIFESLKAQLINPQDPKVNYKILEKLGQSDLASDVGMDIKDAMREWKGFVDGQEPRPRLKIDNEQIHYMDAIGRAKSEEFFQLPIERQKLWIEHAEYHRMNIEAEMMKQTLMQNGPQPTQKEPAVA